MASLPLSVLGEAKLEKGVHILREMIVEVDLKELMKKLLGKETNMNDLLPTLYYFRSVFGSVVPVLLGKM